MKTQSKKKAGLSLFVVAFALSTNLYSQVGEEWSPWGDWSGMGNSRPCIPGASPWVLGGNVVQSFQPNPNQAPMSNNDVGTCNDMAFILKANNFRSVYVTQGGLIGINNPSPFAALDVSHPTPGQKSNFRIYGDLQGNVESTTDIRLHFASGTSFMINEGVTNNSINRMAIANGYMGIGEVNPTVKLEVTDGNSNATPYIPLLKLRSTNWQCNMSSGIEFWNGANHTDATARIVSLMENCSGSGDALVFETMTAGQSAATPKMAIRNDGRLSLGYNGSPDLGLMNINMSTTANGGNAIDVYNTTTGRSEFRVKSNGDVFARYIKVTVNNFPDYVFSKNYKLASLKEVEAYYVKHSHLPEIPSAIEVEKDGMDLGEMNKLLLKKIEELTIYAVEQERKRNP